MIKLKVDTGEDIIMRIDEAIILGGGGSGTANYNALSNKPKINGVELSGDKTLEELNIRELTNTQIDTIMI